MSPTLIREAAYRVGYKNEKIIREMQKMALLAMMEKANQAGQSLVGQGLLPQSGSNGNGQNNQGRTLEASQPNAPSEIQAQIENQLR